MAVARCSAGRAALFASSSHLAAMEMVALSVSRIVLLWKATLLSGSFQLVDEGGVQPRVRKPVKSFIALTSAAWFLG